MKTISDPAPEGDDYMRMTEVLRKLGYADLMNKLLAAATVSDDAYIVDVLEFFGRVLFGP